MSVCAKERERDTTTMCELRCKYKQRFFETVTNRNESLVIVFFIDSLPICISPKHLHRPKELIVTESNAIAGIVTLYVLQPLFTFASRLFLFSGGSSE